MNMQSSECTVCIDMTSRWPEMAYGECAHSEFYRCNKREKCAVCRVDLDPFRPTVESLPFEVVGQLIEMYKFLVNTDDRNVKVHLDLLFECMERGCAVSSLKWILHREAGQTSLSPRAAGFICFLLIILGLFYCKFFYSIFDPSNKH